MFQLAFRRIGSSIRHSSIAKATVSVRLFSMTSAELRNTLQQIYDDVCSIRKGIIHRHSFLLIAKYGPLEK